MSYYRLYFRDYEGHFCGCRQFEAPDEAHAIVRADRMCCGLNRELWGERRLLRRWDDGDGDRLSNDLRQTSDAFSEAMRVRRVAETDPVICEVSNPSSPKAAE